LLNKLGITVLRFWNADVINDPLKVLHRISSHLN
jgi:very-short-patch-repair endonuclease